MPEVIQNVLYLTTPGLYMARDHLTFQIELERVRKLSLPVHHVESICVLGEEILLSHGAMRLALENGVAINYLSMDGHFRARVSGIPDTSVSLRRAHFRAADQPETVLALCRAFVSGKIQNARNSILRGARESEGASAEALQRVGNDLANLLPRLSVCPDPDSVRGIEGAAAQAYFSVLNHLLKQQAPDFSISGRSRRPPRDAMNCLLSFLYALVRHDCLAALTTVGLDPFVGFLHAERANRPSLALDLMEEFRPWLADRLAVTLVNRQQIQPSHFSFREGGAVEFTDTGRKTVIKAYQERKRDQLYHPLTDRQMTVGRSFFIQARILARVLRGDLAAYAPFIPK